MTESAIDTRTRILNEALLAFSQRGYAHTGIREIARRAEVAPSLVIKYFDTKANLFEQALVKALESSNSLELPKAAFGEAVVDAIGDPDENIVIPAMLVLSIGDEEAREIATKAASKHIISATAEWLDTPDARARAVAILMFSTGLTVFSRYMQVEPSDTTLTQARDLVAKAIQTIVDD